MTNKSIYRVVVTSDEGKMLATFCVDELDKNKRTKSTAKLMGEIGRGIVKHGSFLYITNSIQIFRDYISEEKS